MTLNCAKEYGNLASTKKQDTSADKVTGAVLNACIDANVPKDIAKTLKRTVTSGVGPSDWSQPLAKALTKDVDKAFRSTAEKLLSGKQVTQSDIAGACVNKFLPKEAQGIATKILSGKATSTDFKDFAKKELDKVIPKEVKEIMKIFGGTDKLFGLGGGGTKSGPGLKGW